jgi:hypothetical protein
MKITNHNRFKKIIFFSEDILALSSGGWAAKDKLIQRVQTCKFSRIYGNPFHRPWLDDPNRTNLNGILENMKIHSENDNKFLMAGDFNLDLTRWKDTKYTKRVSAEKMRNLVEQTPGIRFVNPIYSIALIRKKKTFIVNCVRYIQIYILI